MTGSLPSVTAQVKTFLWYQGEVVGHWSFVFLELHLVEVLHKAVGIHPSISVLVRFGGFISPWWRALPSPTYDRNTEIQGGYKEHNQIPCCTVLSLMWMLIQWHWQGRKKHIKLNQNPIGQCWQKTSPSISHSGPIKTSKLHPPFIN